MDDLAQYYRDFADFEAKPVSPLYENWARAIASDDDLLGLIRSLPGPKRQANLVFASARMAGIPLLPWVDVRSRVIGSWPDIARIALTHATQTNEPGRCATLLPALAQISGPIALLEVGASAGLCLYPDRYSYRFTSPDGAVRPLDPEAGPSEVVLECRMDADAIPTRLPDIVWRAGLDLNPLEVGDDDALTWLTTLVWPGQEYRRDRLAAAARIARADPPTLTRGDLVDGLEDLARSAPDDATLVIFHSAVLVYVSPERRALFREAIARTGATWISNEGAPVFPDLAAKLPAGLDPRGSFVLSIDGVPRALTGPHGQTYTAVPA